MMFAIMILCQAWTLSTVCTELNTNNYLIGLVGENLPLWALPLSVFLISALISFATGTSYGTMGIMFPLVIPLAVSLITANGLPIISDGDYNSIFLGVIGATFSGALFGDHCSPISDTTTMSAISSRCDLLDHFSSQLPYGIVVLIVSALSGFIFSALNGEPWLAIFLGLTTLSLIVFFSPKTNEIK